MSETQPGLWVTLVGGCFGASGHAFLLPMQDPSGPPYICAAGLLEDEEQEFQHFLRRDDGSERVYEHTGACDGLADMQHAHTGRAHGHA